MIEQWGKVKDEDIPSNSSHTVNLYINYNIYNILITPILPTPFDNTSSQIRGNYTNTYYGQVGNKTTSSFDTIGHNIDWYAIGY